MDQLKSGVCESQNRRARADRRLHSSMLHTSSSTTVEEREARLSSIKDCRRVRLQTVCQIGGSHRHLSTCLHMTNSIYTDLTLAPNHVLVICRLQMFMCRLALIMVCPSPARRYIVRDIFQHLLKGRMKELCVTCKGAASMHGTRGRGSSVRLKSRSKYLCL